MSTQQGEPMASTLASGRAALWEDFIDVLYAPSHVFARRARGNVVVPLLLVTILTGALFYLNSGVLQSVMDAEFDRGMAAAMRSNPRLTPEIAASFRETGMKIAAVFGLLFMPIAIVAAGSATWLIGKLFEASQPYRSAMVVAAYAYVPKILEGVLNGVQGLLLDPAQLNGRFRLTLGIGRFLDPDTTAPLLLAVLGRVDVFTIWVTVLLAIGLSVTGGISRSRAFAAAPLIWAAGAIPVVLQALRTG